MDAAAALRGQKGAGAIVEICRRPASAGIIS